MFYSLDIYSGREQTWGNWVDSSDLERIREEWDSLTRQGYTCRVREVRDLTSGNRWL